MFLTRLDDEDAEQRWSFKRSLWALEPRPANNGQHLTDVSELICA